MCVPRTRSTYSCPNASSTGLNSPSVGCVLDSFYRCKLFHHEAVDRDKNCIRVPACGRSETQNSQVEHKEEEEEKSESRRADDWRVSRWMARSRFVGLWVDWTLVLALCDTCLLRLQAD